MANKLILKIAGIVTNSNPLSSVPDGALVTANNVVIDKDNIAEIRRGFKLFGEEMGNSNVSTAQQLIPYKQRILRQYLTDIPQGRMDYQDTPGSTGFTLFNGLKNIFADSVSSTGTTVTFNTLKDHGLDVGDSITIQGTSPTGYNGIFTVDTVPSPTAFTYIVASPLAPASGTPLLFESTFNDAYQVDDDNKMRFIEANRNLYFTTPNGIKKIDTYNATIVDSGISKAFDAQLELFNDPTGFFAQETQVGYRIVWGFKDANDNLLLGAASNRTFITNPGLPLLITNTNSTIASLTGEANLSAPTRATIAGEVLGPNADLTAVEFALNDIVAALTGDAAFSASGTAALTAFMPITGGTLIQVQEDFNQIIAIFDSEPPTSLTGNYNFATTFQNVKLTFAVPDGITVNDFYQIYRSTQSVTVDTLPNDDYQLVNEGNPTLEQLQAGVVEVLDEQPEEFKGAALYQNPEQEGDAKLIRKLLLLRILHYLTAWSSMLIPKLSIDYPSL